MSYTLLEHDYKGHDLNSAGADPQWVPGDWLVVVDSPSRVDTFSPTDLANNVGRYAIPDVGYGSRAFEEYGTSAGSTSIRGMDSYGSSVFVGGYGLVAVFDVDETDGSVTEVMVDSSHPLANTYSPRFSPDGSTVAVSIASPDSDNLVEVYDTSTWEHVGGVGPASENAAFDGLSWSLDSTTLAVSSGGGTRIYSVTDPSDPSTYTLERTNTNDSSELINIDRTGDYYIRATSTGFDVVDIETFSTVRSESDYRQWRCSFTPDRKYFANGGESQIEVWDARDTDPSNWSISTPTSGILDSPGEGTFVRGLGWSNDAGYLCATLDDFEEDYGNSDTFLYETPFPRLEASAAGTSTAVGSATPTYNEFLRMVAGGTAATSGAAALLQTRSLTSGGVSGTTVGASLGLFRGLGGAGTASTTGAAATHLQRPLTASGSVTTTGPSATLGRVRSMVAGGASVGDGSAATSLYEALEMVAGGVAVASGTSALTRERNLASAGTASSVAGASLVRSRTLTSAGSSSSVGTGALLWRVAHPVVASGSAGASGMATFDRRTHLSSAGDGVVTGVADLERHYAAVASGSAISAGSAEPAPTANGDIGIPFPVPWASVLIEATVPFTADTRVATVPRDADELDTTTPREAMPIDTPTHRTSSTIISTQALESETLVVEVNQEDP